MHAQGAFMGVNKVEMGLGFDGVRAVGWLGLSQIWQGRF